MSEAYLFATVCVQQTNAASAALADVLGSAGARAAWLSEIHWVGHLLPEDAEAPLPTEAEAPATGLFTWPDAPLVDHFTLHALLRALQSGAYPLAVVGQSCGAETVALLLGSPTAVGRWNLPPIARLTPLHVACGGPDGFLAAAAQAALPCLPEASQIACLALAGLPEADARSVFPDARLLPQAGGALIQVNQIIQARQPGKEGLALLVTAAPCGCLATLFEAI